MTRQDWLLMAVAAATSGALSPVQLQKALFLLGRKLDDDDRGTRDGFYDFFPYDYGPFSADVYRDAETLESDGLLSIRGAGPNRIYQVSQPGAERASELRQQLVPHAQDYLSTIVNWVQSLSFQGLVSAIYKAYPEMRVNSVFKA